MGEFAKKVLTTYVESECKRQLFLLLGKNDKRWMDPLEDLIPLSRNRIGLVEVQKLGNKYQQKIYEELITLPNTQYAISPYKNVVHSSLSSESFDEYYDLLLSSQESFCLLEKAIMTPDSFLGFIFNHAKIFENVDEYVTNQSERLIPDIILVGNSNLPADAAIYELLPNGNLRDVQANELKSRFALNIIDIKMSNQEKVNKRQFIEIVFYLFAFTNFLASNNLSEKFFVNIQLSGILPLLSSMDIRIRSIDDLLCKYIPCNWIETKRIFDTILDDIKSLVMQLPCDKNTIELKIQPACGRCDYLDDCKVSLNGHDPNPGNWDIRLIPYTTQSLSEQMKARNFEKIKDVLERPLVVNDPPLPESIYSEMPLIKLKAESLIKQSEILPSKDQISTVSIPSQYYAPCSISFTIEADPIHNKVFGASLYLSIIVLKSKYGDQFEDFWSLVANAIRDNKNRDDDNLLAEFQHFFPFSDTRVLKNLIKILESLFSDKAILQLKGEIKQDDSPQKITSFRYNYAYVNDDLTDESEYMLVKSLLTKIWDLVTLCTIFEDLIFTEEVKTYYKKDGSENQVTMVYRPKTAVYYWSYELLDYLEELTERHLVSLLADPSLRPVILKILNWISPNESKVKDYKTYKKIYDLRIFAETIIGLPFIINYTWHDVYDYVLNKNKESTIPYFYWTPHFNYMDFNVWFWYLNSQDSNEANERYGRIKTQLLYKVRALDRIRSHFQIAGRGLINSDSTPVDNKEIGVLPVNTSHHPLSHAWVMYNLLTSTVGELEINEYRTMYPEYTIGRLNGAEATIDLEDFLNTTTSEKGRPRYYYIFRLYGLSSHMKIEVGSTVYLIPNELRNKSSTFFQHRFKVEIEELNWDESEKCYKVKTGKTAQNLLEDAYYYIVESLDGEKLSDSDFKSIKWYIYPTSIEAWQDKLQELLKSFNFGISWLGFRLAYLWQISLNAPPELSLNQANFSYQEIYYYLPQVLPISKTELKKTLFTRIDPSPNSDSSQVTAINFCLGRTISGIQGPPGTGKSQTIVALVDEFLIRFKQSEKPVRIIITAFSYQALRVLIEKFAKSVVSGNLPSPASKLKRIFLRSDFRDELPRELANDLIKSSSWKYNGQTRLTTGMKTLEDHIGNRYIIFSVTHQLYNLFKDKKLLPPSFSLDLLIVDEASQLPVDNFMSSLQFINNGIFSLSGIPHTLADVNDLIKIDGKFSSTENLSKVIFVGDHNQLPPVQPVEPPKKLEKVLGSIFTYYFSNETHNLESKQLEVNYRSHKDIVSFTESLGYYQNLRANSSNANRIISGTMPNSANELVQSVLDPLKVVNAIMHNQNFETSVSLLEATITIDIIINYFRMVNPRTEQEEITFWTEEIGVVAPHNAQSRLIIRMIHNEMNKLQLTHLTSSELMQSLKGTIFSVEKFQGSARTLILATIGVSSKDQLMAEEEFLYELTRFNVLTSRAKSKFILICSKNFIDYYPNDSEILENSTKIRHLAINFCNEEKIIKYNENENKFNLLHRWYSRD